MSLDIYTPGDEACTLRLLYLYTLFYIDTENIHATARRMPSTTHYAIPFVSGSGHGTEVKFTSVEHGRTKLSLGAMVECLKIFRIAYLCFAQYPLQFEIRKESLRYPESIHDLESSTNHYPSPNPAYLPCLSRPEFRFASPGEWR